MGVINCGDMLIAFWALVLPQASHMSALHRLLYLAGLQNYGAFLCSTELSSRIGWIYVLADDFASSVYPDP